MSQFHRFAGATLLVALLASAGAHAAEVAGVKIDERARVGNSELVLNGTGLRSKLFIKLYVAALYAPQKSGAASALIDAATPRRMTLRMLRDIGADSLLSALEEGLANNNTSAELEAVRPQSEQFGSLMRGLGRVRDGDSVALDFSGDGVALSVNGEPRGKVAGGTFAKALLKVWLGDEPADAGLKKALLGN